MARRSSASDPPVLLVKWYDVTRWLLERIERFPNRAQGLPGRPACPLIRGQAKKKARPW